MAEFIRARSTEQKAQRLEEIKRVAEAQYATRPYHEITLTTIADELGWSRANLYKYVTTKEEIFLLITIDKCRNYLEALLSALPAGCNFSSEVISEIWAGIVTAHQDYFRYGDLVFSILETNVGIEKLVDFKRVYYNGLDKLREQVAPILGIKPEHMEMFVNGIYYHAVGLSGWCQENPLVRQAIEEIGVTSAPIDFQTEMHDFIAMNLAWYQQK